MNNTLEFYQRRDAELLRLHQAGASRKELALKYRISRTRIKMIIERAKQRRLRQPHWTDGLSNRVCNILCNLDIESREAATQAILSGRLSPKGDLVRNYGKKCEKELCTWLGIATPGQKATYEELEACLRILRDRARTLCEKLQGLPLASWQGEYLSLVEEIKRSEHAVPPIGLETTL